MNRRLDGIDRLSRCHLRLQSGQDIVETALVLPIFLLVLFGIIEFGLIIFAYNSVASAAREGARYGVIRFDGPNDQRLDTEIQDHVLHDQPPGAISMGACNGGDGLTAATVVVTATTTTDATVTVDVICDWPLFFGNVIEAMGTGDDTIRLRSISSMRRE